MSVLVKVICSSTLQQLTLWRSYRTARQCAAQHRSVCPRNLTPQKHHTHNYQQTIGQQRNGLANDRRVHCIPISGWTTQSSPYGHAYQRKLLLANRRKILKTSPTSKHHCLVYKTGRCTLQIRETWAASSICPYCIHATLYMKSSISKRVIRQNSEMKFIVRSRRFF